MLLQINKITEKRKGTITSLKSMYPLKHQDWSITTWKPLYSLRMRFCFVGTKIRVKIFLERKRFFDRITESHNFSENSFFFFYRTLTIPFSRLKKIELG